MKKTTILKSLVVAVSLLAGTSAWAEDYYNVTRYSQDFEDASTFSTGWTVQSGNAAAQTNIGSTNVIRFAQGGGSGDRVNYFTSATASPYFATVSDYSFEFEYGHSTGNTNTTKTTIQDDGGNTIFYIQTIKYGTTTVYNASDEELCTIDNDGYSKACPKKMNYLLLTSSSNGTFLTVNNSTGTQQLASTKIVDGLVHIGKIYTVLGKTVSEVAFDNFVLKEHSDIEAVTDPTISITGVEGVNRIVTIDEGVSSAGNGITTYYTIDGTDPTNTSSIYSSPITLGSDCIVKAVSVSSSNKQSGIVSFTVTTGEIVLNTPTWNKTAYDSSTGTTKVELSSNQNDKLLQPTATIYYSIDGETAKEYSSAIDVVDGQTLSYYAAANGYTNSIEVSVTATAPCTDPVWFSETFYRASDGGISVNTEEVVATIGGSSTPYYYMYCDGAYVSENLITSSTGISNWMLRQNGLYGGNTQNYAIKGVKKNDYVTITFGAGTESPVPTSGDGAKDDWQSTNNSYVFKVTATMGNFRFNFGRYGYIKSITVQRAQEYDTKSISAAGYATYYSANALDFSAVEGLTAYVATIDGTQVSFTQVDKVPAETGVLLKGAEGSYQIPVVADGGSATSALVGVLEATEIEAPIYVLMNGEEGVGFYKTTTTFTVGANTAYLPAQTAGGEGVRSFIGFDGESSTGISSVENSELRTESCFDLQGRRVAQPTKGLYIMNGKKTVVR